MRRSTNAHFNPRSPHGERHRLRKADGHGSRFQSTLPARGATNGLNAAFNQCAFQSTLPARGATALGLEDGGAKGISIHAPRTGSDGARHRLPRHEGDFNPRSPHGERRNCMSSSPAASTISIHAPRTGSDSRVTSSAADGTNFNPRSPHGERREGKRPLEADRADFNPRSPHGERLCSFVNVP